MANPISVRGISRDDINNEAFIPLTAPWNMGSIKASVQRTLSSGNEVITHHVNVVSKKGPQEDDAYVKGILQNVGKEPPKTRIRSMMVAFYSEKLVAKKDIESVLRAMNMFYWPEVVELLAVSVPIEEMVDFLKTMGYTGAEVIKDCVGDCDYWILWKPLNVLVETTYSEIASVESTITRLFYDRWVEDIRV